MEHTRDALLIRFDTTSSTTPSRHRSGGRVENPGRRRPPLCKNCRTALHRILDLDLTVPELEASFAGLVRGIVLTCLSCDSYSEQLHYRDHGDDKGIAVLCQGQGESYADSPETLALRSVELQATETDKPSDPSHDERLHQVGGDPFWVGDEAQPLCSSCGTPMRFLAQVDSDPVLGWNFGDAGMLYAFFCATCHEYASFVQDD